MIQNDGRPVPVVISKSDAFKIGYFAFFGVIAAYLTVAAIAIVPILLIASFAHHSNP